METIEFEHDRVIARKNDKVKCWYLIQQGCVIQKIGFSEVRLEKNFIIGFMERDMYLCDYVAAEDTVLAPFSCDNPEELKKILAGQENIRNIFLRAALLQRHQLLSLYSDLYNKARQFGISVGTLYEEYKAICVKYKIAAQGFSKMESFAPLTIQHRAERWEVNSSISIVRSFMQEYLQLMKKDDSLTVGIIMETSAQMRRFTLGIGEIQNYMVYNKDILIDENQMDLFKLYFDLSIEMYDKKYPTDQAKEKISQIMEIAKKLQVYNARMIERRQREFEEYDYAGAEGSGRHIRKEIDILNENGYNHILEYAGYTDEEIDQITEMIKSYFKLPDLQSTDSEVYGLRRKITAAFYEIYNKVFHRAMKDESSLTPVLEMFLNFGFMDASLLTEEQAKALYNLCAHLDIFSSQHVFTVYEWLKLIYKGKKETSKNEFGQNYPAYLNEMVKEKRITKEEMQVQLKDREQRLDFEIRNMFTPVNRLTNGKVTTFCPILSENGLIGSIEKMMVTADKVEDAINEVRKVDYSIFYREVPYSAPEYEIPSERVMKEVLPDIILMPNAGIRGMMWQETEDVKNDTPARFMFSILCLVELPDLMIEAMGRYRWEMCRKIEGVRWNDLREKSLTAEYCGYIQFYKKNSELSTDVKEKIKGALSRAKNNYREVFVKDYINLIRFEAKGSYRLNKLSRDILVRYCPFAKAIRNELRSNPFYQMSITKFESEMIRKQQRYAGLYNKYEKAGGTQGGELKETIQFYEM